MPIYFQRPENALKRANEFIEVGKKQQALDALYDVIKSKKHRTWQKIHEPIMLKYLELCVELRKSHIAKEGLYQYKIICQQVNIKSLEDVVRKYLSLAEDRTEEARQDSHSKATSDIDDLDVLQTPESVMLSAVSGEDTQARTDRAILIPWVKFLWESYRQCLDLLRNNSHVERLYQDVAQQGFKFCLKYERKTEFRKLCDNLRIHLGHIHRHTNQVRAINLSNPESQAMHQETRLVQLDSAIKMELWQEAFKAVEDIHGIIAISKNRMKPSLMANYYNKLALVFWKSGCHMFHAATWHRLLQLSRDQKKNFGGEELRKMTTQVLCATLAIPICPARSQMEQLIEMDENAAEKQRKLATLVGLASPPTRASLLKDLVKTNIIQYVNPEVKNLFRYLEVDFHPLQLAAKVTTCFAFLQKIAHLSVYVPSLQAITMTRLVKQVAQIYRTIEFKRLLQLAPFANSFELERIVVDAAKNLDLQVRVDHRSQSLTFGSDLSCAQKEDISEGPDLQSMPSESIRNQLCNMATVLEKACSMLQQQSSKDKRTDLQSSLVKQYIQHAKTEHRRTLMRRQIIEERKEQRENINMQREMEEKELAEKLRTEQVEAERARLEREAEEREQRRRELELKEIKLCAARDRREQLLQTESGRKLFNEMKVVEIAELDADEFVRRQVEQLEKEKKEFQEKLRTHQKKFDYMERAKRLEELPLLEKSYQEEQIINKADWEVQEAERIEKLKEEREIALVQRDRLARIINEKNAFFDKLRKERTSVFKEKLKAFDKMLNEKRMEKMKARKDKRREERRLARQKKKEEEAQRKIDEELKRKREAEEIAAAELKAQEEAEYLEKMRRLDEQAEKQRQRELEIEKKRDHSGAPQPEPKAWRPSQSGQGGWREREQQRSGKWLVPSTDDPSSKSDADSRPFNEKTGWRNPDLKVTASVKSDSPQLDGGQKDRKDDTDQVGQSDHPDDPRDSLGRRLRDGPDSERDGFDRGSGGRDRFGRGGFESSVPRDGVFDRSGPRDGVFDRSGPRDGVFDRSGPRDGGYDRSGPRDGGFGRSGPRDGGFDRYAPRDGGFDRSGPRDGGFDRSGPRDGGFDRYAPRDGVFDRSGRRDGGFDRSGPRDGAFDRGSRDGFERGGFEKSSRDSFRDGFDRGPRSTYDRGPRDPIGRRGPFDGPDSSDRAPQDDRNPRPADGNRSWRKKVDDESTADAKLEPSGPPSGTNPWTTIRKN